MQSSKMDSQSRNRKLHFLFFPYMAPGHMIPNIDMARIFARHGVKATVVTTPLNAPPFSKTIERDRQQGVDISVRTIKFPSVETGLPEACENVSYITSLEMELKFDKAINLLQQPFEQLVEECRPNCLVVDMMFTWASDSAAKFKIPRLTFHGTGFFPLCVYFSLKEHRPHKSVTSECELFTVPGLPDQIKLTRQQLPSHMKEDTQDLLAKLAEKAERAEIRSYGVLVNSFRELEPAYAEHYRKVIGRKSWHIGPVSLCNKDTNDKAQRGDIASICVHECFRWLDSKEPNSVLYVCFGSTVRFSAPDQLFEIATGLEASGKNFIWVIREEKHTHSEVEWLPEGFERRVEGRGLIIKGWAPQILILDHESVGGFMTHCGWNSTLESITAGVPMVTWPLSAEQFCNEKLVTDILKIGLAVGAQEWSGWLEAKKTIVKQEDIKKAVTRLMVGEEAEEMRIRVRALKEMAKRATEEGGSSNSDLNSLLEEMMLNYSAN